MSKTQKWIFLVYKKQVCHNIYQQEIFLKRDSMKNTEINFKEQFQVRKMVINLDT